MDLKAISHPDYEVIQRDGRIKRWSKINEANGKYLRVILLEDHETVHNAFFDKPALSSCSLSKGFSREIRMKVKYFKDTDTLYIEFNKHHINETRPVNDYLFMDLDEKGNPVSLTIEHAKAQTDISEIQFEQITEKIEG